MTGGITLNKSKGICVTKHLQQLMVLGAIVSNGSRMSLIFFDLKDTNIYVCSTTCTTTLVSYQNKVLRSTYLRGRYYMWQRDQDVCK